MPNPCSTFCKFYESLFQVIDPITNLRNLQRFYNRHPTFVKNYIHYRAALQFFKGFISFACAVLKFIEVKGTAVSNFGVSLPAIGFLMLTFSDLFYFLFLGRIREELLGDHLESLETVPGQSRDKETIDTFKGYGYINTFIIILIYATLVNFPEVWINNSSISYRSL